MLDVPLDLEDRPAPGSHPHCINIFEGTGSMRRLLVVLLVALGALLAGPTALAAPPTHETIPVDDVFFDPSCGFPIEGHVTGFAVVITWANKDGSSRVFVANPQLKATLTNLNTGSTYTENISGPAHITVHPDGTSTLVGTGLWGFDLNPQTGAPGASLNAGRLVATFDAAGNETSFQIIGHVTDLCAKLAP
jgi:hypothetical protein